MAEYLDKLNSILWGAPALIFILGVGLFLSIRTGFVQFTLLGKSMRHFWQMLTETKKDGDGISPMQALCTALAATVGTGNLVGVAGAICLGGPGAVFWMWIGGLLGMCTKFCETTLAIRYRIRRDGEYMGGPMYTILGGMGKHWKPLAICYAVFGLIAAFGVGNATQINAVAVAADELLHPQGPLNLVLGIVLAALLGTLMVGGGKRIGQAAQMLVPIASGGYLLLCIIALILGRNRIIPALESIFVGAFDPRAVTGGLLGSAFRSMRVGCARGVFTNEAGLGTASIAHAGAEVDHPCKQGLLGIVEVFVDTIVICTMTALVILVSGVSIPYGVDRGGMLTNAAFVSTFGGWASGFLAVALCCFAIATVLGWGLYGIRCAQFLFGNKSVIWFVIAQSIAVVIAAVADTAVVWQAAETVNGLMAIPNLVCLAALSGELARLTREYKTSGMDQKQK